MLSYLCTSGKHGLRAKLAFMALLCALCAPCANLQAAESAGPEAPADGKEALEGVRKLDTVVVSATGVEQKIVDAPASITVITQEELASKPYITLLDALRNVEGVDVGETTDKLGQGTVSIRGMGSAYTLILINGKRQNANGDMGPNNFGGGQFNHIPPLDTIERIEVIRGPMSTLYGADAMGGVINIITKKNVDKWSGSVTLGYTYQTGDVFGDNRTADASLMGPLWKDKLSLGVHGSFYGRKPSEFDGYTDVNPATGGVHTRELGFGNGGGTYDNKNWSAGASLAFTPTKNQDIYVDFDTSRQSYEQGGGTDFGTMDSWESILRHSGGKIASRGGYKDKMELERTSWSATHNGRWGIGNTSFSVANVTSANEGRTLPLSVDERVGLQDIWDTVGNNRGWTATANGHTPNAAFNALDGDGKLAYMLDALSGLSAAQQEELLALLPRPGRKIESRQTTYAFKYDVFLDDLFLGDHMLVAGAEYIDGEFEDGVFSMSGTSGFRDGTTQSTDMWSVYGEDSWSIFESFTLTGGIRYDHHVEFSGNVSPRLYAVWNVIKPVTLKGGVSSGYKTPTASQLFDGIYNFGGQGTTPLVGNPDLKPEKSLNYELALYYQHDAGHNFNVTGFYNRFKDKITSSQFSESTDLGAGWTSWMGYDTYSKADNVDRVDIKGVEVSGTLMLPFNLSWKANYTFTDSEQKSGSNKGEPLGNSARHMVNTTLNWEAASAFNVFLETESRFKRYANTSYIDSTGVTQYREYYKNYTLLNLGAAYRISEHFTVTARVNNLLDKEFDTYNVYFYPSASSGNVNGYLASYSDDYNNKYPGRNFWVSINCRF